MKWFMKIFKRQAGWLKMHHWSGKKVALVGAMDYEWAVVYLTLPLYGVCHYDNELYTGCI